MIDARLWIPYCGAAPEPGMLLARWNLDPVLLVALAALAVIGTRWAAGPRERAVILAAAAAGFILFVSPFCALSSALFAARSAHHVALTTLVAPLLAAALPRARLSALPGGVAAWTGIGALTLWLWHAPPLYEAALSSDLVYWLMQASLLGTSFGFWAAVRRSSPAAAVVALLGYMVQMGLLGALLTFSQAAFYAPHALTTLPWGLTPLADQQLAGLIMWVPGAIAYLGAALVQLHRVLGAEPRPAATA